MDRSPNAIINPSWKISCQLVLWVKVMKLPGLGDPNHILISSYPVRTRKLAKLFLENLIALVLLSTPGWRDATFAINFPAFRACYSQRNVTAHAWARVIVSWIIPRKMPKSIRYALLINLVQGTGPSQSWSTHRCCAVPGTSWSS